MKYPFGGFEVLSHIVLGPSAAGLPTRFDLSVFSKRMGLVLYLGDYDDPERSRNEELIVKMLLEALASHLRCDIYVTTGGQCQEWEEFWGSSRDDDEVWVPPAAELRRQGEVLAHLVCEYWASVGGPDLYHDSYTLSVYLRKDQLLEGVISTIASRHMDLTGHLPKVVHADKPGSV